jgi:hypothetical protein
MRPAHGLDGVLLCHVDDVVGAEPEALLQPRIARAGEDHRVGAQRLGDSDA